MRNQRKISEAGKPNLYHVKVRVNGIDRESDLQPRLLLVHYIRDVLGLTGTHVGCDTSNCGACTIILNGKSVKSCTIFAVQADGGKIETIESLAKNGELHPIQRAFWENFGLQCGFCTPGIIMQTYWFLSKSPNPTNEEIRAGISGNLCRCTGYQSIIKSIKAAAEAIRE